MFYVYILKSEATGQLYIGQTNNPDKRLEDHNRGASNFTKNKGHWKRICLVEFQTRTEALALEKKLKTWKNPKRVESWIYNGFVG